MALEGGPERYDPSWSALDEDAAVKPDPAAVGAYVDLLWSDIEGYAIVSLLRSGRFSAEGRYVGAWQDLLFEWPADRLQVIDTIARSAIAHDVFVGQLLHGEPNRRRGSALAGHHLWADVDLKWGPVSRAKWAVLAGPGAFRVDSGSPGHVHAYLPLDAPQPPERIEALNKRLADHLGADAKWDASTVLRPAGTLNHKGRARGGPSTSVRSADLPTGPLLIPGRSVEHLEALLPAPPPSPSSPVIVLRPVTIAPAPARETARLAPGLAERLNEEPVEGRRSHQHFALVALAMSSGLTDAEIQRIVTDHRPSVDKYGSRLAAETERTVAKLRVQHPHPGQACHEAGCAQRSSFTAYGAVVDLENYDWKGMAGLSDRAALDSLLRMANRANKVRGLALSVRDLAVEAKCSPMTASRALRRLENRGLISRTTKADGLKETAAVYDLGFAGPVEGSVEPPDTSDTWRWQGLGRYAYRIWQILGPKAQTPKEIEARTGIGIRTINKHLGNMADLALARPTPVGWVRGAVDPSDVEANVGVAGATARQEARHRQDRANHAEALMRLRERS